MQLNRAVALAGVKGGTLAGVALAFLLSGTYVKVVVEIDTREQEEYVEPDDYMASITPEAPAGLRFE